jgi:ribosomal protein L30
MAQIKVKQVKSSIKRLQKQKRILESLGLRGIGKEEFRLIKFLMDKYI